MKGRITLGLYNTYDRLRLTEAHRRAIARVGPLAHAFDMNIALIEFPFEPKTRPKDLSKWIRETSSVGGHGAFLTLVEEGNRILIVDRLKGGFPPQLGTPVATTCRPAPEKSITLSRVAEMSAGGETILLVFGLGPKGLPKKVRDIISRYQMDVTPDGTSLETCTALGAVASALFYEISARSV